MTIACEDRDFPEWHQGIPHAYLWGAASPVPLAPAREALDGYLLPRYERQPHVTVTYCGLAGLEFDDAQLGRDVAALQALPREPATITPSRWGSFLPSPTLEVESAVIMEAHRLLAAGRPASLDGDFTPHVTLGFYSGSWRFEEPLAVLRALPLPGPWQVGRLQLLRYDTHDIAGPLTVVGEYDLLRGAYTTR